MAAPNPRRIAVLAAALLAVLSAAALHAQDPPPVEIHFVPRADLHRAPAYSEEGAFLPLDELLGLARQARLRASESPGDGAGATCRSIALKGELKDALELEGTIEYDNPLPGWGAVVVDDGSVPWIAQEALEGAPATLARVDGRGMLFVKGPGAGRMTARTLCVPAPGEAAPGLSLGTFRAPARIEVSLPGRLRAGSVEGAVAAIAEDGSSAVVRPRPGEAAVLALVRKPEVRATPWMNVSLDRRIEAAGGGLDVVDAIAVSGGPDNGTPLRIGFPPGMEPLTVRLTGDGDMTRGADGVLVTLPSSGSTTIEARFAAKLSGGRATLGDWQTAADMRNARVALIPSADRAPALASVPGELTASSGDGAAWRVWGGLPDLEIELVERRASPGPAIRCGLDIGRERVRAVFDVAVRDVGPGGVGFAIPEGWILEGASVTSGGEAVAHRLQGRGGGRWRMDWASRGGTENVAFALRRGASWAEPGTPVDLAVPVVAFEGARPERFEFAVRWPEELEVRLGALSSLAPVSIGEVGQAGGGDSPRLALAVVGADAAGSLAVTPRAPDLRAEAVTSLSVLEDRAEARLLLLFDVRYAAVNAFRFKVEPPPGPDARLDGEEIREVRRTPAGDGEEWTVITQRDVLGRAQFQLQWRLEGGAEVTAPQVRALDVTSQRGFIVLDGSGAMRLGTETKNLAETDLAAVPPIPWGRERRALAAYRYVEPPYLLRVKPEAFEPEPLLGGYVSDARLVTTVARDGSRIVRAEYEASPRAGSQFFEAVLPAGATLWSVLVNGEGAKPARRGDGDSGGVLLAPYPSARTDEPVRVTLVYHEAGEPLEGSTRLDLAAPRLPIPINRSTWELNLPPGFEYLDFSGSFPRSRNVRLPLATLLRTWYYPDRLVFVGAPLVALLVPAMFLLVVCASGLAVARLGLLTARRAAAVPVAADGATEGEGAAGAVTPPPPTAPRIEGPPSVPKPASDGSGCASRVIALIVAMVVIAVLAAIAVPNFLEAQVRSKSSRVRSDLHSLATAIESYYVDNNAYPTNAELLWQGPVKYLTGRFTDPYADTGGDALRYRSGEDARRALAMAGVADPQAAPSNLWFAWSVGPDGRDDGGLVLYDPTNGTVSAGDIIRAAEGISWSPAYGEVRDREEDGFLRVRAGMDDEISNVVEYQLPADAPAEAGVREEAEMRKKLAEQDQMGRRPQRPATAVQPPPPPAPAPAAGQAGGLYAGYAVAADSRQVASGPLGDVPPGQSPTSTATATLNGPAGGVQVEWDADFEGLAVQSQLGAGLLTPRQAGLLSLAVEVPEGGVQRRFEGLVDDPSLSVRFLEWGSYQRLRFVLWMAVFLALATVWVRAPRRYPAAFVAVLAGCVVVPLILPGAFAAFFNAAFQGLLFSLAAPLASWTRRHVFDRPAAPSAAALLLLLALPALGMAKEAAPPEPVRITVPYTNLADALAEDGGQAVFISRADFERLWNAAWPDAAPVPGGPLALSAVAISATYDPATASLRGEMRLRAVGLSDEATTMGLKLAGLAIGDVACDPPGAVLDASGPELVLRAGAGWSGMLRAQFETPCASRGGEESFALELPGTATGAWRVTLPYARADVRPGSGLIPAIRREAGRTVVTGATRGGPLALSWSAAGAGRAGTEAAGDFRAGIDLTAWSPTFERWAWSAKVSLEAEEGALLPETVRLTLDPGVLLDAAQGEALLGLVEDGGAVDLRLDRAPSAAITLSGFAGRPAGTLDDATEWTFPGLRMPAGDGGETTVRLMLSPALELLGTRAKALDRRATDGSTGAWQELAWSGKDPDWKLSLDIRSRPVLFDARVREAYAPVGGFLRHAAQVALSVPDTVLRQTRLRLPEGARAVSLEGSSVRSWVQSGRHLTIDFSPPLRGDGEIRLVTVGDRPSRAATFALEPLGIEGARSVQRTMTIAFAPDEDLVEVGAAGAAPRAPDDADRGLVTAATGDGDGAVLVLRSWEPATDAAMRFRLEPVRLAWVGSAFNLVTLSDGRRTLEATVRAVPTRGRLRTIEARLLLPAPDPMVERRIQSTGPVRHLAATRISETEILLEAELMEPAVGAVEIGLRLDQAAGTEDGSTVGVAMVLPPEADGARAWLAVRRDLEGQVDPDDLAGARPADVPEGPWPGGGFRPAPADRFYELAAGDASVPSFRITRHARAEVIRAVVEVLRLRAIITADGVERHELEIVLQNESEQFLKIALPHPRSRITVYEVQVGGMTAPATFGTEDGREVLLAPLIRTGLLEPELTVRVAYVVEGGKPLGAGGRREHRLPEILGGVPVAQSALVLMLPSEYRYGDFKGSLKPVELVDIEVDEAARLARRVQKLSEVALKATGVEAVRARGTLMRYQSKATAKLDEALMLNDAFNRNIDTLDVAGAEVAVDKKSQEVLVQERFSNLGLAQQAQELTAGNFMQLDQTIGQGVEEDAQVAQQQAEEEPPSPPAAAQVQFPRSGDVFAFRQLQGTGSVSLKYSSREVAGQRQDFIIAAFVVALAIGVIRWGRWLVAGRRRAAVATLALSLALMAVGFAADLGVLALMVGVLMLLPWRRRKADAPGGAAAA